jgi:hypothetical protein
VTVPDPAGGWGEIREALDRYQSLGLIISWEQEHPGELVVIDGAMHEIVFRSPASAVPVVRVLEGAECAIRTGKIKTGSDGGGDRG